jgi:nitrogen fixation-related uncharacterized protein
VATVLLYLVVVALTAAGLALIAYGAWGLAMGQR